MTESLKISTLVASLALVVAACHHPTEPPKALLTNGLAGSYVLVEFIPNNATTGSLTLRADSTYSLTLDPWPVNKYADGCTVVSGNSLCLDDADTNERNPDLVGAQSGTWRFEGGHMVSLQPPAPNAEAWYGLIDGPDLVFDSGFYPSATFRKE